MRHLDLFSGIGGFALAASWVWGDEHEIVSFCDNDKAAQIVLNKHWPGVPIHDDIKTLDATKCRGAVDLVTGGFPCQPFSSAGKRRGKADDRYLWPEMLRIIAECRPRWVLGENVAGIIPMALSTICADLEAIGYETIPIGIPSCAVGTLFRGKRIWIIAMDPATYRRRFSIGNSGRVVPVPQWNEFINVVHKALESAIPAGKRGRMSDGISSRVHRLRLLGNAIVPQVAEQIFRAMKAVDK